MSESSADKIIRLLHEDTDIASSQLNAQELKIRARYLAVFTKWLDSPSITDKEMVKFITKHFEAEKSTAYKDIAVVKRLLGDIKLSTKALYRYQVIEMAKAAYNLALKKKDSKSMSLAIAQIIKATQLDKPDEEDIPYDQIVPPTFEPSPDSGLINLKVPDDFDAKRERLRQKYLNDIEDAQVIKYE